MKQRYLFNLSIAIQAVLDNKLRSVLTALGIIFGVAAVISMLAIGTGAKKEILDQIELVGVNNIVIDPVFKPKEGKEEEAQKEKGKKKFSPGLTLEDAESIQRIIPTVRRTSPEIVLEKTAIRSGNRMPVKLIGVTPRFFEMSNLQLQEGKLFNEEQLLHGAPVCIIGKDIQTRFFSQEKSLNKMIKCGQIWLRVIGVLEDRKISDAAIENLGIRNYNTDIYVPVKTALLRYRNRAVITSGMLRGGGVTIFGGGSVVFATSSEGGEQENEDEKLNYHQLDKLVIQVEETEQLTATAGIVSRMLKRRHNNVPDFEITVPELMLKQQQRTKDIFNIVLGAIAGISLIVGGIGIMNIMLASVMERIKEIGVRLSIGATKEDIIAQFLLEAVLISLSGGIIGVLVGVILAKSITQIFDIQTIVTFSSVLLSFFVSAGIGLAFGIMPAKRAAQQDPIKSLRHE